MEAQTPWAARSITGCRSARFRHRKCVVWLREYRFDGLRLDAVHAIPELGEISMLHDLSVAVGKLAAETRRHIICAWRTTTIPPARWTPARSAARQIRAQWNDDYHHAWHVWLTGETQDNYATTRRHRWLMLRCACVRLCLSGRSLRAFAAGSCAASRAASFIRRLRQLPAEPRPSANRALGDRLESNVSASAIEAALAITLLAPMVRCCSWRGMGSKHHSRSSAISRAISERPYATAGARNSQASMRNMATRFRPAGPPDVSIRHAGLAITQRTGGTQALALVQRLLAIRRREIVPRLRTRPLAGRMRRIAIY